MPFLSIASLLWGNQWMRLAAVAVACFGVGWVKGWNAYPRVDVAAVVRNAEAGRDAEWSRKLAATEEQARLAVDAAVEAREHTPAVGPSDDLVLLCKRTASCRDKSGS